MTATRFSGSSYVAVVVVAVVVVAVDVAAVVTAPLREGLVKTCARAKK